MNSTAEQTPVDASIVDVCSIVPRDRHPLIFDTFDNLPPGQSMILINDHEPRPLYYQFLHERPEQFSWAYLQEGPLEWRVRITRLPAWEKSGARWRRIRTFMRLPKSATHDARSTDDAVYPTER